MRRGSLAMVMVLVGLSGWQSPSGGGLSAAASAPPVNQWKMRNPDGPNIIWENGIAYDPATHLIAWYGGHAWGYGIGAGLAVGLAGLGCGIGQGLTAGNTTAGIARNPGAAGAMFTNFILGMVLIESIAIYGLLIAFLLYVNIG